MVTPRKVKMSWDDLFTQKINLQLSVGDVLAFMRILAEDHDRFEKEGLLEEACGWHFNVQEYFKKQLISQAPELEKNWKAWYN